HPHVVAIHAVDAAARLPYLVMPLVAGESLQQRLDRCGPLAVNETLRIALQAAQGLAAAHAQGLVHRDVKPANILLENAGVDRVMLTDFGLARAADDASLTRSGVIPGTPQYMSPEQARGEYADCRSDLFSLGSVLYAMCAGHPPFRAETALAVLRRISDQAPRAIREVNPDTPPWLAKIIGRLHAKRPEDRYSSADELAEVLEQCVAHLQQPTVIAVPKELVEEQTVARSQKPAYRRRIWVAAACGIFVAACVGLFRWTVSEAPAPDAGKAATAIPENAADESASRTETAGSAAWDDGFDQELQEIDQAILRLESWE
ncbi:MAG: serine/threonine protein kinase, partial [Planctomycetes bacterium]|nr:serine/threonine protein kinase [Planctomycetota bacterium]